MQSVNDRDRWQLQMPPIFIIWIAEIGGFLARYLSGGYTDGLHALAVAPMAVLVARSAK